MLTNPRLLLIGSMSMAAQRSTASSVKMRLRSLCRTLFWLQMMITLGVLVSVCKGHTTCLSVFDIFFHCSWNITIFYYNYY